MSRDTFTLQLKTTQQITPSVRHLGFIRADGGQLPFIPGQFITIHFEHEGKLIRRSYSLATIPGQSNELELAASFVKDGLGTQLLFGLQINDTVQASGPFGRLILGDEQPQRYILIATGTGVTPYRAMLPELIKRLEANPQLTVHIILGVQYRHDLLYAKDFLAFSARMPRLTFSAYYSRDELAQAMPFEYRGRIQASFESLKVNPAHDLVYLCGNPAMIDDSFNWLVAQGFSTHAVRREKYISSK